MTMATTDGSSGSGNAAELAHSAGGYSSHREI